MHIIKRKSIFKKIFPLMIIVSVVSGSLILGISLIETLSTTEEHIIEHHEVITHIASKSVEVGYYTQSWPVETLEEVSECEGVLFWWIVKPDGEILLADDAAMVGEQINEQSLGTNKMIVEDSVFYKTGENIKLIAHPLEMEEDGKQWMFYVGVSLDHIIATRNALITNGVIILGAITILAVFISAFFTRSITRPIIELTEGTKAISQGNLDYEIKTKSEDEIGNLAKSFKHMQKEVKSRTVTIENLLEQKDEFIHMLGHDLKNPLGVILNLIPIVEKEINDPDLKKDIQVCNRNVQKMKELIFNTLELAKSNEVGMKINPTDENLSVIVNDVVENKKTYFSSNNVEVNNIITNDIFVHTDKILLSEVFDNLLTNAVKYSKKGGGNVAIDASSVDNVVKVSVTDDGIGLSPQQITNIFNDFYMVSESKDMESHGLGLSITKRIVEKHNGKIWAESLGLGKGTTIYFTIPLSSTNEKTLKK